MGGRPRKRIARRPLAVMVAIVVAVVMIELLDSGSSAPRQLNPVTVESTTTRSIPAGFLGLSIEFHAVLPYAGQDPLAVNPILRQLIINLTPGQHPSLRIGGDSTDFTWWPVPGMARPPGITYTLTPRWMQVTRALAKSLSARLILGVDLEAGSVRLAQAEGRALVEQLGSPVSALEVGNEPVLYPDFAWYRSPRGKAVLGRPHGYTFAQYLSEFKRFSDALPPVAIAGPALGPSSWRQQLSQFLAAEPQIKLVTLHAYPLQLCFISRRSPRYPSIKHLLSNGASTGFARNLEQYVDVSHGRGLPLRIDETNNVSCGGDVAVSNAFASALWALDTMFELVRVGVDGVNVHTFPGAGYELFHFRRAGGGWLATVSPEYYGLLMFAQGAPPGSQLLKVAGAGNGPFKCWATRTTDGTVRAVLINKGARELAVPLKLPTARSAVGSVERLTAPSASASSGVSLGGRTFGSESSAGKLAGPQAISPVRPVHGTYRIEVPAYSAALLTAR